MKNNIFALALIGLIAASCGTSGQYASSRFDDAIYSGPDKTIVIASATDTRLQDLKERTAQTSTITVNGKEAQVVYIDENNTADIPLNLDEDNTYLVIDESISYEELLRKFDSPDYTINLHIESRWNDWDYYRPWMYDYRPWSWRYHSRYYMPWGYYPYYNPYFRDPFFYSYSYFYGSYYDMWGPYWFNGYRPYYGSYYDHYNYGGYYGYGSYPNYYDRPYFYGEPNRNSRGKVYGKRPTEQNYSNRSDSRADNKDRGIVTSIPRQGTTSARPASRDNSQNSTTPVRNSVYRRGNTSTQGISYGENTVNQTERSTERSTGVTRRSATYNSGTTTRNENTGQRQSTGNYRKSTSTGTSSYEAARNSGNSYNSSRVRSGSSTSGNSSERSSSYNNQSRSSSSYSRSSESSSYSRSTSSSSSSGSSSGSSSRSSSSTSSSESGYRR